MSNIHKISRLTSTYKGYLDRTEICRYPPTRVWVEATSNCNLRCSFCGNRDLTKDQRGNMSFELFQQLADEAAGKVNQFNLFHRGESLLHPRIGEMIRYAGARGIHTRINTNGTLLNANLGAELINAGLDMLSFSFDGYDPEMYEANRPGAHFDRVLGNILGFLELKKAMNACKPFVTIEVMEIADVPKRDLMEKQRAFVHKFKGLPLDKFIIRKQHNWAGMIDTGQKMSCNRIPCPLLWHAMVVFWGRASDAVPSGFFRLARTRQDRRHRLDGYLERPGDSTHATGDGESRPNGPPSVRRVRPDRACNLRRGTGRLSGAIFKRGSIRKRMAEQETSTLSILF